MLSVASLWVTIDKIASVVHSTSYGAGKKELSGLVQINTSTSAPCENGSLMVVFQGPFYPLSGLICATVDALQVVC